MPVVDHRGAPLVRFVVKHPWFTASVIAGFALAIAALVVVSGIVPITASSGHWAITARFLDFAKTRSVALYSWGIEAPPLDDEGMVLKGAAHYERGCFECHGGPGAGVSPVMAAMTPPPPQLPEGLARWTPAQLFSIVKHGIKLTGMPAWPVPQRDDEVWAVVAFLRRMPDLDAAGYRRLVEGDRAGAGDAPRVVVEICARCHGADGTGRGNGAIPGLVGGVPVRVAARVPRAHTVQRDHGRRRGAPE